MELRIGAHVWWVDIDGVMRHGRVVSFDDRVAAAQELDNTIRFPELDRLAENSQDARDLVVQVPRGMSAMLEEFQRRQS